MHKVQQAVLSACEMQTRLRRVASLMQLDGQFECFRSALVFPKASLLPAGVTGVMA